MRAVTLAALVAAVGGTRADGSAPALVPAAAPEPGNATAGVTSNSTAPVTNLQASSVAASAVYTISDLISSSSSADSVKTTRPPTDGPLKVDCRVIITNFMNADQVKGTFEVQGTVMTVWQDSRLVMPSDTTRVQLETGDVWTPTHDYYNSVSTTIAASKVAYQTWDDKSFMIHEEQGATLVSTERFVGTFAMRMSFGTYPFDKHALPIQLDLFGNPSSAVEYRTVQVELKDGLEDPSWGIAGATSAISEVVKPTGLKYSRMTVHINVNRLWINKAFSIYTPLVFIYVLSYGSYFVDPGPLPARTALTIVSLLSAMSYYGAVSAQLPARGYMTFIDVYCVFCIASCGIAVALFLRVHWLMRLEKKADFKPDDSWIDKLALGPQPEAPDTKDEENPTPAPIAERLAGYKMAPPSGRLDILMRAIWPWFFFPTFLLIIVPMVSEFIVNDFQVSDFA
jgi:hypothetical protein